MIDNKRNMFYTQKEKKIIENTYRLANLTYTVIGKVVTKSSLEKLTEKQCTAINLV